MIMQLQQQVSPLLAASFDNLVNGQEYKGDIRPPTGAIVTLIGTISNIKKGYSSRSHVL